MITGTLFVIFTGVFVFIMTKYIVPFLVGTWEGHEIGNVRKAEVDWAFKKVQLDHQIRALELENLTDIALEIEPARTCGRPTCTICEPKPKAVEAAIQTPNEKREEFDYANITVDELLGADTSYISDDFRNRIAEQCRSALQSIYANYEVELKNITTEWEWSADGRYLNLTFKFYHPKTGQPNYMRGIVLADDAFVVLPQKSIKVKPTPKTTWSGNFGPY